MKSIKQTNIILSRYAAPVGQLDIYSVDKAICYIKFASAPDDRYVQRWIARYFPHSELTEDQAAHQAFHKELTEYFAKKRKRFLSKIHLVGTDFQLQVWTALRTIPYGETTSYRSIAILIGNPKATRAVGGAIGKNPVSIVVPCHRVIGENGNLVGFGGGIENKKKLLLLEGALIV